MTEAWYALGLSDIQEKFGVDPTRGLSSDGAKKNLATYGANVLPRGKKASLAKLFAKQFVNPLIIILLIAALLTLLIEEYVDLFVIVLAVIVNVGIGFWQEYSSSKIFEKLQKLVTVRARVMRDGKLTELDMAELVPGDIILVRSSMKVPADARLLNAENLLVNESILTGESNAVHKEAGDLSGTLGVGDRTNMLHMGTTVERGEGTAVVVATGPKTEIGAIAGLALNVEEERTPLQERLSRLGEVLAVFMTLFSIIIFVSGLFEGKSFIEMFTVAVAVAVAAIPEGLPAALSVVLAVSASRILKKRGLVKKLVGAETLGSTTVIVTDKTGTLTKGTMVVERMVASLDDKRAARALAFSSDVVLVDGSPRGESTDVAKVEYYQKMGGAYKADLESLPRIAFLPFDQTTKYLASFHAEKNGNQGMVLVSGAPESLLELSHLPEEKKKEIHTEVEKNAAAGYRLVAAAEGIIENIAVLGVRDEVSLQKTIKGLTFLGVAAIRDPIRDDVRESIVSTRKAGIRVIMATGDHKLTALAIAKELGFSDSSDSILTGPEIESMPDNDIADRFKKIEILARVNPEHKMKLVSILRDAGEVVAMTGDGVNDAPALKAADIGIALGSGSDVTKETADLVLLDDSFSIITEAIRQGRIAFDNIRKVGVFLLSNSFTEIIIVLAALIFKTSILPITAVQILWANLVEDTFPNFALAFEPGEADIMERKPLPRRASILDRQAYLIIFIIGLLSDFFLVGLFLSLVWYSSLSAEHIQTLIFALLASNSLFIVFAIKSYHASIFRTPFLNNPYLLFSVVVSVVLLGCAIYVPVFQHFLGTVSLPPAQLLAVIGVGVMQMFLIEGVKWYFRHKNISGFAKQNAT